MSDESSPDIRFDLAGHVATITLNRPEKLNAFRRRMAGDLVTMFDRIDADDAIRAVILTGAGKVFCAGADLDPGTSTLLAAQNQEANGEIDWSDPANRDFGGLITLRMYNCLKPVIVAFNGSAVGIGVTMSLAADYRIASSRAKFALPFVRRGIVPESAASWFLPRIVGVSQALRWVLSGETFTAEDALAAGLVSSLHEPEDVLSEAMEIAASLASQAAPVSVALARQMIWRSLGMTHPIEAHRVESRGLRASVRLDDAREGVASFLEKREPNFRGSVSSDIPSFFPWWEEPEF